MKNLTYLVLLLVIIYSVIPPSFATSDPDSVTLRLTSQNFAENIDPIGIIEQWNLNISGNLFIGLVQITPTNPEQITPQLARSWETSEDGLTYTFHLRDDVPWVHYDPQNQTFEQVRMVNAEDVVYAARRLCSIPDNSYYASAVIALVIEGCREALYGGGLEKVQVKAIDDYTVAFTLTSPGDYFLSIATLWSLYPVPVEIIERYGSAWTHPEIILTNGPFVLAETSVQEQKQRLIANPYFPDDLRGPGNADEVEIYVACCKETAIQLYNDGLIDFTGKLSNELIYYFKEYYPDDLIVVPSAAVRYLGFSTDKFPFDNVHIRRAFSAAINRRTFVAKVALGTGQSMNHFAPPGIFGGLPGDAVGVGYDLDYAKQELAEAGYPDCVNMPQIQMLLWYEEWGTYLIEDWQALGCSTDTFIVYNTGTGNNIIRDYIAPENQVSVEARPHIWTSGWAADYPDVDSFMLHLACGNLNDFRRECSEVDQLIIQARQSADPEIRISLYRDIQKLFFGSQGEFPIAPLYRPDYYIAVQSWVTSAIRISAAQPFERFDYYTIAAEKRRALTGN